MPFISPPVQFCLKVLLLRNHRSPSSGARSASCLSAWQQSLVAPHACPVTAAGYESLGSRHSCLLSHQQILLLPEECHEAANSTVEPGSKNCTQLGGDAMLASHHAPPVILLNV